MPLAQQWPSPLYPKFQFFSSGAQPNSVSMGARKLNAVTIAIDSQTMPWYTLEKLRTRSQAQIAHFKKATAKMSLGYRSAHRYEESKLQTYSGFGSATDNRSMS